MTTKRKEIQVPETTRMHLEHIMPMERNSQKTTYCVILFIGKRSDEVNVQGQEIHCLGLRGGVETMGSNWIVMVVIVVQLCSYAKYHRNIHFT